MPDLHLLPGPDNAYRATADFIAAMAEERARAEGRFTIALSGGSTPRRLFRLLASPPYSESISWAKWHIFWGDERCVPPDHEHSNYRMARESLLDFVPVPSGQIYRIRGEASPDVAARDYEQTVLQVFGGDMPVLDLVLLGLGEDGHTASLFPESAALREERRLVVANWVSHLPAHRITFTLPLINAARTVAFLVADESKAEAVRRTLAPRAGDVVPPAALVRPTSGSVHWFLTRAAAGRLQETKV